MTQENDRRNRAEQMASIIRQNLKRAITRQGVSQQEVARKAGMNPASFSQMLNGNKRLLFEDMYAVCDVLGLNIADLMDATSLQNEMQQKVEALLKQANQLTDQANNLKQQAVTLQHADALGNQAKGALVGVGSPGSLSVPSTPTPRSRAESRVLLKAPWLVSCHPWSRQARVPRPCPQSMTGLGFPSGLKPMRH